MSEETETVLQHILHFTSATKNVLQDGHHLYPEGDAFFFTDLFKV